MSEKYEPIVFNWKSRVDGPLSIERGYVLVKKGFLGKIKAAVVDVESNLNVASYKTIIKKLEDLSDRDILILINYFEQRRMSNQVHMLELELSYRKRLLIDKNAVRPKHLRTFIKYNIKKKNKKIRKYTAQRQVKIPNKDFILLSTAKRKLDEIKFVEMGFKIAPEFRIINPAKYVKALDKNELNEIELFKKIHLDLLKLIKSYLKDSTRISKKGNGVDYKFSLNEDLFSDPEFLNQIILFGNKYGIEFESMPLLYSFKKRYELQLENEGLSEEQITKVISKESTLDDEKNQMELENRNRQIKEFNDFGIICDENGVLNSVDRNVIIEIRNMIDEGQVITIFDLSNAEIIELSEIHTQVRKK